MLLIGEITKFTCSGRNYTKHEPTEMFSVRNQEIKLTRGKDEYVVLGCRECFANPDGYRQYTINSKEVVTALNLEIIENVEYISPDSQADDVEGPFGSRDTSINLDEFIEPEDVESSVSV